MYTPIHQREMASIQGYSILSKTYQIYLYINLEEKKQ